MNPEGYGYFIAPRGKGAPILVELLPGTGGGGPVPASAIVPGPQISTLRSVTPTTPALVEWASTGYVDFVADCGADPTGATDCTAALDTAFTLLSALAANPELAETAVELFVPPGQYLVTGAPAHWSFTGGTSSVRIRGVQDASVFVLAQGAANTFLLVANAAYFIAERLTFVGGNSGGAADTAGVFDLNQTQLSTVRDCRFLYLLTPNYLLFNLSALSVERCNFQQNSAFAVVWSQQDFFTSVSECRFSDIALCNGFLFTSPKEATNNFYIYHTGSSQEGQSVRRCFFDEGCAIAISLQGDIPTGNLRSARIEQCTFNSPINAGSSPPVPCVIDIELTNSLVVDGVFDTNATGNANIPFINLVGVKFARVRDLEVGPGALARYIKADATTNFVRVEDSAGFLADDLFDGTAARSLAGTNEMASFGTDTYVECFAALVTAAVAVGSVLKISAASTFDNIATTDGVGLAAAVALDTAGISSTGRVARRGQIVTVLSDGTTTIAIGDGVTSFGAAAAGRVLKATPTGTTPIIGTAVTGAASGGGPVLFDMLFEMGLA